MTIPMTRNTMRRILSAIIFYAVLACMPIWALSDTASLKIDAYKDKDTYLRDIPTIVIDFVDSDEPNDIGLITDLSSTITKYVTSKQPKDLSETESIAMTLFTLEITSGPNNSRTGYEIYISGDRFKEVGGGTNNLPYSLVYAYTDTIAYNYFLPIFNISKRTGKLVKANGEAQRFSVGTRGTFPVIGSWYFKTDVAMAIKQTDWDRITALGNATYQATITVRLDTV